MLETYNIRIIATGVIIGDKVMTDTELTPEDIYKSVEINNIIPKTNACLETDYRELFEEATKDGGSIIHFTISEKLSASHANAKRAAEGLQNVHIINSKMLTVGIGVLAMRASEMRAKGMATEQIVEETIKLIDKLVLGFVINDLKYLYKGGRASGLKLLAANALKIRPSLDMDTEGRLVPTKKFKGEFAKAVKEWTAHKLAQYPNANKDLAIMAHSDIDPKISAQLKKDLKDAGFKEIIHLDVGVTITIHCGRNTIGFVMFND